MIDVGEEIGQHINQEQYDRLSKRLVRETNENLQVGLYFGLRDVFGIGLNIQMDAVLGLELNKET